VAVLDLYAGSGALGLEALSRGAGSVLFVESDPQAAAVITRNIAALGLPGATLRRATVTAALSAGPQHPVQLVLADPPYELPAADVEAVLAGLDAHGWVGPGTVIAVERPASSRELAWPPGWTPWRARRYGDTRVELAEVD
jgi:16S rRNA (guanine966-N2)-methyltransferase